MRKCLSVFASLNENITITILYFATYDLQNYLIHEILQNYQCSFLYRLIVWSVSNIFFRILFETNLSSYVTKNYLKRPKLFMPFEIMF